MKNVSVFIYSKNVEIRSALEARIKQAGYELRSFTDSVQLMDQLLHFRPRVLMLYLNKEDEWVREAIKIVQQSPKETKIIYATENPGEQDIDSLEEGIFYYAGNASVNKLMDVLDVAVKGKPNHISSNASKLRDVDS